MESALEVLSRAATMVNTNSGKRTNDFSESFSFKTKKGIEIFALPLKLSPKKYQLKHFFFSNLTDNRLTINKELPTTKWRRDRRIRLSTEYHHNSHESVGSVKPLGESNQSNSLSDSSSMEIPLDMSVGSSKPPPPPYRDPLPGSTFSAMSRPSVITQAPKREITSNQENKESPKKPTIVIPIDIIPTTTTTTTSTGMLQ